MEVLKNTKTRCLFYLIKGIYLFVISIKFFKDNSLQFFRKIFYF